ncbi:hypothetical protein NA78x_000468 [Anatilimnocola sp. NA78]|uniref:hypothetical protein n=1 Tax=Anatilimnocola sp. NA78 TaxID=3415683 RepID=UPI003CE551CB
MAKKRSGLNKSLVIRNYKEASPTASPKEIVEALGKQGVAVSSQFVSTVLSNAKKKGGVVGRPGRKSTNDAAKFTSGSGQIDHLIQAKKLVDKLGGIDAAKSAINSLALILG